MKRATKAIPLDVQGILAACTIEGTLLKLPEGQLSREIYIAVNKVLEGLGGMWNRKLGGHVFQSDPREAVETALLQGSFTDQDQLHQFFETPPEVADRLIAAAKVGPGMRVLDPSAGRGALVRRMPVGVSVYAFEIDVRHLGLLLAECACSVLRSTSAGQRTSSEAFRMDFLAVAPHAEYDAVVMNPPSPAAGTLSTSPTR